MSSTFCRSLSVRQCQTEDSVKIVLHYEMLKIRPILNSNWFPIIKRTFTTKAKDAAVVNKYTDTVNLPKTKFPARIKSTERENVMQHVREVSRCD